MPHFYGGKHRDGKGWLVFEYVQGEICNNRRRIDLHKHAVILLAKIQRAEVDDISLFGEDTPHTEIRRWHKRLRLRAIKGYPAQWIEKALNSSRFFYLENPSRSDLVLSHGDFKPDNLIYTNCNGVITCYPVDWIYASIRPRWCDIGFLTEDHVSDEVEDFYWQAYWDEIKNDTDLSKEDAKDAFLQGRLWACMRNVDGTGSLDEIERSIREICRLEKKLAGW